jgi:hypothetical protein
VRIHARVHSVDWRTARAILERDETRVAVDLCALSEFPFAPRSMVQVIGELTQPMLIRARVVSDASRLDLVLFERCIALRTRLFRDSERLKEELGI